MGKNSVANEDAVDWSDKNESALLNIIYERVKQDINDAPTFKPSDWKEMDEDLFMETGVRYGADKVKGKYNRLRIKQRLFSDLLEHTGVTYDLNSNTVHTAEDVWQMFYKKNKMFRSFRKHGCNNYQLLTQVFGKSTATGQLHHASTQLPPTSDEERQTEEVFLSKNTFRITESETEISKGNRPAEDFIPGCIRAKKESKYEKLDSCLQMWASSLDARAQKDLAKVASYKDKSSNKATSPLSNPYSIDNCMYVLEMMEGVSDDAYLKVVTKFTDPNWRNVFLKMSDSRRKIWIANLA